MSVPNPWSGPDYRCNADKCGDKEPCVLCGRKITSPRPAMIRVVNDQFASISVYATPDDVDMGCYPIGASCLKRHPELKELTR